MGLPVVIEISQYVLLGPPMASGEKLTLLCDSLVDSSDVSVTILWLYLYS